MLAVRIHAPGGKLALEEVPLPEPSGSEVRVRVAGCGVCHTDVHIARGEMTRVSLPLTLGHEVSGWVDAWEPAASAYVVAARNASDVVAAVNFAREHNLRLVVKGLPNREIGTELTIEQS